MTARQMCRICLTWYLFESNYMVSLFDGFVTIFCEVLPLSAHKDDGLPSSICKKCHATIYDFYKLKREAIINDKTLRKRVLLSHKNNSHNTPDSSESTLGTECIDQFDYRLNTYKPYEHKGQKLTGTSEKSQAKNTGGLGFEAELSLPTFVVNKIISQNVNSLVDSILPAKDVEIVTECEVEAINLSELSDSDESVEIIENRTQIVDLTLEDNISNSDVSQSNSKSSCNDASTLVKPSSPAKLFRCNTCGKTVKSRSSIVRHLILHTAGKLFKCTLCKKQFTTNQSLLKHLRIHKKDTSHKCDICGKGFFYRNKLILHMRTHTGEKPFACDVCKKVFTANSRLKEHKKIHEENTIKSYECDKCSKRFTYLCSWKQHQRSHSNSRPFHCSFCEMKFNQKVHLDNHTHAKHTNVRTFLCSTCGDRFPTKYRLDTHVSQRHNKDEFQWCEICGNVYSNTIALNRHLKIHSDLRRYICDICGNQFKTKAVLMNHMETHIVKKLVCCFCEEKFWTKSALSVHAIEHINHQPPYTCSLCPDKFDELFRINLHMNDVHLKI